MSISKPIVFNDEYVWSAISKPAVKGTTQEM